MRKCITFLTGCLILLASCSVSDSGRKIKVISYNIRYSQANDGENRWENRKHASVAMVEALKPDVLGVQEALSDQMDYLGENLPGYSYVGVGRDDGDRKGEYAAVFYNNKRFEALDEGCFWLSETPDEVSRGWDAACNRTVAWVRLKHRKGNGEFFVFNTHLDHKGKVARRESIVLLANRINEIAGEYPVFITGDFNMTPDDSRLELLLGRFGSARSSAPVTDNHGTFNGWKKGDGEIIDYIFYRQAKALSYRTITDGYGVPFISDHYPIIAEFEL